MLLFGLRLHSTNNVLIQCVEFKFVCGIGWIYELRNRQIFHYVSAINNSNSKMMFESVLILFLSYFLSSSS